jgi:AcrR family transcriptional regulator
MNEFASALHDAGDCTRQRILATAYELYSRHGLDAVDLTDVVGRAGVTRSTLERHFPTEESLVLAFLVLREQAWTLGMVRDGAHRRGDTPEQRLLTIFDVFEDPFDRDDFEGSSFINILLEMGPEHPLGQAAIGYLTNIRALLVRDLAAQAGLRDPDEFAKSLHILMKGSTIAAAEGDADAAKRARAMARRLIEDHRDGAAAGRPESDGHAAAERNGRLRRTPG